MNEVHASFLEYVSCIIANYRDQADNPSSQYKNYSCGKGEVPIVYNFFLE